MENALEKAISFFDGKPGLLADAIDVSPSVVSNWRKRGQVAVEKCLAVEKAVEGKVTRYDLRPDIYGEPPQEAA